MNQRKVFGRTAGALAAMSFLVSRPGEGRPVPPSDQVNLGVIGVSSRGQQLMQAVLRRGGVPVWGLSDVYEPRFARGSQNPHGLTSTIIWSARLILR
ncbi:MAG TPA: hypothetical protein VHM88_05010 [Candidatus Acidoferrales bacterium]|nr:hypothetical protein [Candidatus Acidoferrales bacterium]